MPVENEAQHAKPVAEKSEKTAPMKLVMTWVGYTTALIGLGGSILGGVHWYQDRQQQRAQVASQKALAESQLKQGEYQASIATYDSIIKGNSLSSPALKAQLDTTMAWVEDFHVTASEGDDPSQLARPDLDRILAILEAGLTQTSGPAAADVQAHLGWAHWLNRKIAEREFGPAAENNFRAALATDPSNVYANAMLAHWLLQTGGSFAEANSHFKVALATGKVRPFVRRLQIGGLTNDERPGARTELIRTVNDMRIGNEALDEETKLRILSYAFDPPSTRPVELTESLSAVPPDETLKTYNWLDDAAPDDSYQSPQRVKRDYVAASILEISGKRVEALAKFRNVKLEIKGQFFTLEGLVDEAIKRLSQS
jgi:tetratricopeptide (TPR) repeat protein